MFSLKKKKKKKKKSLSKPQVMDPIEIFLNLAQQQEDKESNPIITNSEATNQ